MDKISIIVPVYNVEPYLGRCIDSLITQSYMDLEIILIDDCSSDKSAMIMATYAEKDSRIRCFYQSKNQGVSAARNLGLKKMDGDWVCFCDGDDWYLPNYVETMLACAKKESADYVICDYQIVSDQGKPLVAHCVDALNSGCDPALVVACGPLSSCVHMFHRRLFSQLSVRYPYGCRRYEELAVIPVLAKYASKIGIVHDALYCYFQRRNGTSASNSFFSSEDDFLQAFQIMSDFLGVEYEKEMEYHAIYALFYGEILLMCKRKESSCSIRQQIEYYEKRYPNYASNPYMEHFGKVKKVFFLMERCRLIIGLRLYAKIHQKLIG